MFLLTCTLPTCCRMLPPTRIWREKQTVFVPITGKHGMWSPKAAFRNFLLEFGPWHFNCITMKINTIKETDLVIPHTLRWPWSYLCLSDSDHRTSSHPSPTISIVNHPFQLSSSTLPRLVHYPWEQRENHLLKMWVKSWTLLLVITLTLLILEEGSVLLSLRCSSSLIIACSRLVLFWSWLWEGFHFVKFHYLYFVFSLV